LELSQKQIYDMEKELLVVKEKLHSDMKLLDKKIDV
jgi:hypothetical protein